MNTMDGRKRPFTFKQEDLPAYQDCYYEGPKMSSGAVAVSTQKRVTKRGAMKESYWDLLDAKT